MRYSWIKYICVIILMLMNEFDAVSEVNTGLFLYSPGNSSIVFNGYTSVLGSGSESVINNTGVVSGVGRNEILISGGTLGMESIWGTVVFSHSGKEGFVWGNNYSMGAGFFYFREGEVTVSLLDTSAFELVSENDFVTEEDYKLKAIYKEYVYSGRIIKGSFGAGINTVFTRMLEEYNGFGITVDLGAAVDIKPMKLLDFKIVWTGNNIYSTEFKFIEERETAVVRNELNIICITHIMDNLILRVAGGIVVLSSDVNYTAGVKLNIFKTVEVAAGILYNDSFGLNSFGLNGSVNISRKYAVNSYIAKALFYNKFNYGVGVSYYF